MNGIRKPAFHDARYNRLKCLDSDVRSRPLQSARRACFGARTVVILHREQPYPRKPYRGILRTSVRDSSARIFPIARWERGVPLSDKLRFVRQRSSLCEAGDAPKSRPFLSYIWIPTENRQTRPARSPERRVINTLSGLTRSKISASTNCSAKPDWSITGAVLSSNDSLARNL